MIHKLATAAKTIQKSFGYEIPAKASRQKRPMKTKNIPAIRENVITFLKELELQKSPSDFAACLREWSFSPTESTSKLDPTSDAYKQIVLRQYHEISGKSAYLPARDELDTVFNIASGNTQVVYPYTTRDPVLAGSYMVGVGLALRAMQVPAGGTIVEYGIGWGHTTLALAQLGYKVIAVDIEEKFLKLAKIRAAALGLDVTTHHGEFGELPDGVDAIDGVLFFECFHHCLNHGAVVADLTRRLAPKGRIVFAGEPLFDSWIYPWGMRMDGQSIWAIATHGWMELGFDRNYLEKLLRANDLHVERHYHKEFGCVGEVYVGIKS